MKRDSNLTATLAERFSRLRETAQEAEKQPQLFEAMVERARLNVYMENLGKLPGGISFARAEAVIKKFYGKGIPEDPIDCEILGFYEANLLLNKMLEEGFTLSKETILKLYTAAAKYEHSMTEEEKTGFRKGAAYSRDVVNGKVRTIDYALPEDIDEALEKLIEDILKFDNPLAASAIFHVEYESIHPTKDVNGRTGRLLIYGMLGKELTLNGNLVLEQFILEGNNKGRYIRTMNAARGVGTYEAGTLTYKETSQREGSPEKFLEYFAEIYEAALKAPIKARAAISMEGV